jgi:hypothetical protein
MPDEDPWFDETEPQKEVRRKAAGKFLEATKNDPNLRADIAGFENEAKARAKFEELGQINLPPDVRVICLEPDRREMAKLVVFSLLDPDRPTPAEPYREHWIAAWPPYK